MIKKHCGELGFVDIMVGSPTPPSVLSLPSCNYALCTLLGIDPIPSSRDGS